MIVTKYGNIEGVSEHGCMVYKGIPYAKAPVGELRFRKPQKLDAWDGIFKADCFGNKSVQVPAMSGMYLKEFYSDKRFETQISEDCLYLNIWVPDADRIPASGESRECSSKLPVGIYVHGGAFVGGAGSNLPFVCHNLAKKGVIVVTINYRLGLLGFLSHPALGIEGENAAGGNYGLWDQLEALCWVRENIEAFGGDAKNITFFGQSAGAMSLQTLALSGRLEDQVQGMILQSGGGYKNPLVEYRSMEKAMHTANEVLDLLGFFERHNIDKEDASWTADPLRKELARSFLQKADVDELLRVSGELIGRAFRDKSGIPFVPIVDGELLGAEGNALIEQGEFARIPYILGANGDDITTDPSKNRDTDANQMHRANADFADYVNRHSDKEVYLYYFDRKLPGDDAGAFHSAELWYVFGSLKYCWRPLSDHDRQLSETMMTHWSNFMKTKNPNLPIAAEDEWTAFKNAADVRILK